MSATLAERTVTEAPPAARRRGLRVLAVAATIGVVAAIAMALLAPPDRVTPTFPDDVEVVESDWGNPEAYGVEGSRILRYEHDTTVQMTVPWEGEPVVDVRLGDAPIHLLTVTEFEQRDAALDLTVHRDNCRWFHERSIDVFDGVTLTLANGSSTKVLFDRPLLAKSPMLASCPDRTYYRQDDQRPARRG